MTTLRDGEPRLSVMSRLLRSPMPLQQQRRHVIGDRFVSCGAVLDLGRFRRRRLCDDAFHFALLGLLDWRGGRFCWCRFWIYHLRRGAGDSALRQHPQEPEPSVDSPGDVITKDVGHLAGHLDGKVELLVVTAVEGTARRQRWWWSATWLVTAEQLMQGKHFWVKMLKLLAAWATLQCHDRL